jgi:PhzF family phenazine biosynthesis protein
MRAGLHQVVTFATHAFRGNPAFVLTPPDLPSEDVLTGACELIGADVLAVIMEPEADEPYLSFFAPEGPHPGAGHAALAAAHVALDRGDRERKVLTFKLPSGEQRAVRRTAHGIAVDWPLMPYEKKDRHDEIAKALGKPPVECLVAPFGYVALMASASEVAKLTPDLACVAKLDRNTLIVTAKGNDSDIVIRVFAPRVGLPEDPVCGTAHRIIAPYWAKQFGKPSIHSRHLSKRGGDLWCEVAGNTVTIAGKSIKALEGALQLPD